jgi:preprotein translocase SecF subunit
MRKYKVSDMAEIINLSVNETLSRTIMTVSTTLIVCLALVVFGGEVIKGFSMAMLFGIAFGTYSSVYIAAPVLMHTGFKKLLNKQVAA